MKKKGIEMKITKWWESEVKEAQKEKKNKYKQQMRNGNKTSNKYQIAGRHSKKERKIKSWQEYCETLNNIHKEATEFFSNNI